MHPAVPEGVVGDEAHGRCPGGASASASQPASSRPSIDRDQRVGAARRAARACRPPACPAPGRRAAPATRPGRRRRGTGWARRPAPAWIESAQKPLVLTRWVTTSCTVQPSQRLGCCHSSSRQVARAAPRAAGAAARRGAAPGTRTSTARTGVVAVARGEEHGGTVAPAISCARCRGTRSRGARGRRGRAGCGRRRRSWRAIRSATLSMSSQRNSSHSVSTASTSAPSTAA